MDVSGRHWGHRQSLIDEDVFKPQWPCHIKRLECTKSGTVKKVISKQLVFPLIVQLGYVQVRTMARIIYGLEIIVSLGTMHIDKWPRGIFSVESVTVKEHLESASILAKGTEEKMTIILFHEAPMDEQNEHVTFRAAKLMTVLAETELLLVVVRSKHGPMTTERIQAPNATQNILPQECYMKYPRKSCSKYCWQTSGRNSLISIRTLVFLWEQFYRNVFVESERNDGLKLTEEVNAVRYRNKNGPKMKIGRHMKVEYEDVDQKGRECKEEGRIDPKVDAYHDSLFEIITKFKSIWDGHLRCIRVPKHRIELASDKIRPIHRALYEARPRERAFEKTEIDNRLKRAVIKLA